MLLTKIVHWEVALAIANGPGSCHTVGMGKKKGA